ncbi:MULTISPECIES: DUF6634 family protein [unclassified Bradyrhizobium]|uniref:DUF6634 family protein n=1 Tax=unclassified Bradyrhizobium TaxID=2631580 RepID=UPI00247A0E51|nr:MULTISPECIES: DUF6634 family protein [unclassified Bradyrhizobium]WGS18639.1 hypothetical protein MTX22_29380 [Bradyrhizobium sp. ISRA463]WGS25462.1 hypothetical protein MTX19_26960 [Bradyrhizobium sp. ISRA464]
MLTQLFPFLDPSHVTPDLSGRLRDLADDCNRLELGRSVLPLLKQAPLLDDWVPVLTRQGVQLVGRVTGHPILGDCTAATTHLWFADPDGAWVRTLSRFYRLGPPLDRADVRRFGRQGLTSNAPPRMAIARRTRHECD